MHVMEQKLHWRLQGGGCCPVLALPPGARAHVCVCVRVRVCMTACGVEREGCILPPMCAPHAPGRWDARTSTRCTRARARCLAVLISDIGLHSIHRHSFVNQVVCVFVFVCVARCQRMRQNLHLKPRGRGYCPALFVCACVLACVCPQLHTYDWTEPACALARSHIHAFEQDKGVS